MHKSFKGFAVSDVSTFGIDLRIWSTYMPIHASASSGERGLHRLVFSINKKVDNRAQKKAVSKLLIYIFYICFNGAVEKSSTPNPCAELPLTLWFYW